MYLVRQFQKLECSDVAVGHFVWFGRAKDGWTIRTKRNLTITDIALGAKRKTQGGRGWKTTLGGGKVFVAPSQGRPALVATGQKAFKMSMSRRKKGAL